MEVLKKDGGYLLKTNIGSFNLWAVDSNRFYPEDLQVYINMNKAEDDSKRQKMDIIFNENR